MDIQQIVTQLKQQLSRIDTAILALEGSTRRGRPPKGRRGPRTMSAMARAKIAAAQRARWAKQKRTTPKTAVSAKKKATGRKPMSAASRKKLSVLMKARWAQRKKAS
jgi:hypothetical protein